MSNDERIVHLVHYQQSPSKGVSLGRSGCYVMSSHPHPHPHTHTKGVYTHHDDTEATPFVARVYRIGDVCVLLLQRHPHTHAEWRIHWRHFLREWVSVRGWIHILLASKQKKEKIANKPEKYRERGKKIIQYLSCHVIEPRTCGCASNGLGFFVWSAIDATTRSRMLYLHEFETTRFGNRFPDESVR
jgi:hypothetical protein